MTTVSRVAVTDVVETSGQKKRAGRGVLVAAAIALLLVGLPYAFRGLDYFHVQTVQLEGAKFLTPTSVIAALGADTAASVFDDPARFVAKLESDTIRAHEETERERLRSALLSSLSHDLRTPLASILGSVTSLRELGSEMTPETRGDFLRNACGPDCPPQTGLVASVRSAPCSSVPASDRTDPQTRDLMCRATRPISMRGNCRPRRRWSIRRW